MPALSGRGNDDMLPFVGELRDKPVTVDGCSVYLSLFRTLQRCWAHILRDAEDVCISNPKIPYYRELYRSLKLIFHRAKEAAARTTAAGGAPMSTCTQFADEMRDLAARYGGLKFAGTLHAAADNRFTFLRHPGMPPTNNGSERDMRDWVVPIREASHKFMTERGMRVVMVIKNAIKLAIHMRIPPTVLDHTMSQPNCHRPTGPPNRYACPNLVTQRAARAGRHAAALESAESSRAG